MIKAQGINKQDKWIPYIGEWVISNNDDTQVGNPSYVTYHLALFKAYKIFSLQ